MAILFCGIVMSHYTHLNLSPVAQITTQLTFRTIAFIAGVSDTYRLHQKQQPSCAFEFIQVTARPLNGG